MHVCVGVNMWCMCGGGLLDPSSAERGVTPREAWQNEMEQLKENDIPPRSSSSPFHPLQPSACRDIYIIHSASLFVSFSLIKNSYPQESWHRNQSFVWLFKTCVCVCCFFAICTKYLFFTAKKSLGLAHSSLLPPRLDKRNIKYEYVYKKT